MPAIEATFGIGQEEVGDKLMNAFPYAGASRIRFQGFVSARMPAGTPNGIGAQYWMTSGVARRLLPSFRGACRMSGDGLPL